MSNYTDAVRHGMKDVERLSIGPYGNCQECRQLAGFGDTVAQVDKFKRYFDAGDIDDEGHFSEASCYSCGSTLAGLRYDAHGFIEGELVHFSICPDCVRYHANGEEPETWEGGQ